jgi:catechol 2,3-dioxygenase-like lactoylglutathione lyase family enzyme
MAHIVGFHHLSLSVTDLHRSTKWYQDALGLEMIAEIEGDGFRRNRMRAPDSTVILTLTQHDAERAERFDERHPGMDHVAVALRDANEVHDMKGRLEELGVDHSDVKQSRGGATMITLRDPDNIQLEVFGGPVDVTLAGGSTPS